MNQRRRQPGGGRGGAGPVAGERLRVGGSGRAGSLGRRLRVGGSRRAGSLGRRLRVAFVLVALSSVVVLTLAALIGTERGLAGAHRAEREAAAARVAAAAAGAYQRAGGWSGADLGPASATAEAAGARLVVSDRSGGMVWPGHGMGPGAGPGAGPGVGPGAGSGAGGMHDTARTGPAAGTWTETAIEVSGQRVGTARLVFPAAATGGRTVAWSWVIGAAVVALAAALLVSGYVARRLTRPMLALADAARRFAAGDRTARAGVAAPGELGEVARAFDGMAEEVARAERVRRRLAADVAHELRTPLAALQAGLEELRDGLRPADPERLAALHDQSLRLGRVVQDLAELSAAESAALSLHPRDTDLAEVARGALAAQRPQLEAAGLTVVADLAEPLPVRADPDRIHQAVANLLANAARYCRPGDRVEVRAFAERPSRPEPERRGAPEPRRSAVLEVRDTGPGIPVAELPHVFERMWRGRQADEVTGSGIGLAVVRELVTAHGGQVGVASPAGGGSTGGGNAAGGTMGGGTMGGGTVVTIRLPLREQPPGAGAGAGKDRVVVRG